MFAHCVWLLVVSDSWDKGLEGTQVARKADVPQESSKGVSVFKHTTA